MARAATLTLIGIWLGLLFASWAVAGATFRTAEAVAVGPAILELGRSIDFVPRPLAPDVGRRFGLLHGGYVVLDLAKAAALIALAILVARRAG